MPFSEALCPVQFAVTSLPVSAGNLQTLTVTFTEPQALVHPRCLPALQLPPELDLQREVVLYGRSPAWLYGHLLLHLCHAAPWLGCYDARSQSVVVIHSRINTPTVGDTLPVQLNRQPCPTLLIGGPPNSGKSVLSNALRLSLINALPEATLFLHRASWDGEGNWTYETQPSKLVERLVGTHEYRIHEDPETAKLIPQFFEYHADAVKNLRQVVDCLLVDVGGLPQPEKIPLMQQCSHFIIISRLPEAVALWQQFCQPTLQPLAVVHSVLETRCDIRQTTPWVEVEAGPWRVGETETVPEVVLQPVLALVQRFRAAHRG